MRARTINEVQKFERGAHPRASMDLGGILLSKIRYEMKQKADKEWREFINSLIGKTITGNFNKILLKDLKPGPGWGDYTIKVEKILNTQELGIDAVQGLQVSYNDEAYIVPLGDKFYIVK